MAPHRLDGLRAAQIGEPLRQRPQLSGAGIHLSSRDGHWKGCSLICSTWICDFIGVHQCDNVIDRGQNNQQPSCPLSEFLCLRLSFSFQQESDRPSKLQAKTASFLRQSNQLLYSIIVPPSLKIKKTGSTRNFMQFSKISPCLLYYYLPTALLQIF